MALIPQSPTTPINGANSYQSLIDARALAELYGYTLPVDDTEAETSLIKGFRNIELLEPRMCGTRTTTVQNTAYPRTGVTIRGEELADDVFPLELLLSQVIGAQYAGNGTDLSGGVDDGKSVTQKVAGKVSISYADNGKTGSSVSIPEFDNTIEPLLCSGDGKQYLAYTV